MTPTSTWLARLPPLLLLTCSATSVGWHIVADGTWSRMTMLRDEQAKAQGESSKLTEEIHQLRKQVAEAKGSPAAVERFARDELGLVRRNELVFQFRP